MDNQQPVPAPSNPEDQPPGTVPAKPAPKESSDFISKAAKGIAAITVLSYVIGFIIWQSYLNQFGISISGLLPVEFLSAAVCYLILLISLAFPPTYFCIRLSPAMTANRIPLNEPSYIILGFWAFLVFRLQWAYFPKSLTQPDAFDFPKALLYTIAFHVLLICVLIKKFPTSRLKRVATNPDWFFVYPLVWSLILLATASDANPWFILGTMFLPIGILKTPGTEVMKYWIPEYPVTKVMIALFLAVVLVVHIESFGRGQFGAIPRSIGGGRPQKALFSISPDSRPAIESLALPIYQEPAQGNVLFGPVLILFRNEKDIFFVVSDEVRPKNGTMAKSIREGLVDGIQFVADGTNKPSKAVKK